MESRESNSLPRHVAVIGAAGGLGKGILEVCREKGIGFTAIVRSRPERIANVPAGSCVEVVTSLKDESALSDAFAGAQAVLTAVGVTATSFDNSALLSQNMATLEKAMLRAEINRVVVMNTLLSPSPGEPASLLMRFFSCIPGKIGRGARELKAVVDALGRGEFSRLNWTLVRGGVNISGVNESPLASLDWSQGLNSWRPVSYQAMGLWMLQESIAGRFIKAAPFVSRKRD
ncbi:MAG: NAD(P)H-binding protein [Planctomycetota bacterium]